MPKPSLISHFATKIANRLRYRSIESGKKHSTETDAEKKANALLRNYPSNHEYSIANGQLFPSFQLFERLSFIRPLYPQKIERFLDVGCCRGFFVFDIAARPECIRAVGIDVDEPFIEASKKANEILRHDNATFHIATLDTVTEKISEFGGPFDLICVLGLYHYLYWGSSSCPKSFKSHNDIFSMLAKLCTGQVILSGRLEIERLPNWMRKNSDIARSKEDYNTSLILKAASRWFDIADHGFMSNDSVYVLTKK